MDELGFSQEVDEPEDLRAAAGEGAEDHRSPAAEGEVEVEEVACWTDASDQVGDRTGGCR
jgi:hypothetical protein